MNNVGSILERIRSWLNSGTGAGRLIRKVLVVAAAILILYRLGYAIGKLLFHIGP